MKRLAIFLITIFTMFSCEDFYKDNGCIEMYEGNTETSCTVYFYNGSTKWDNVYVYSWGDAGGSNDELMFYDGSDWYYETVKYPNVIFHSEPTSEGWGEQTGDLDVYTYSPYFTPTYADVNTIYCDTTSYKYEYTLPTYDVYFYNGELNYTSLKIIYGSYMRGEKTMTYDGDGWYYAETIYPKIGFINNNVTIGGLVDCEDYTYFVADANTLTISEYSSKPDL